MFINQKFFNTIEPVLNELKDKLKSEFVVFGSGPLYLLNVLELKKNSDFNDLDIAIKDESVIPKEAQLVYFKGDPNQKLYKIKIKGINVDIGSVWPGQEDTFDKIFENPIVIKGFKFASLDICQEWKELMRYV